MTDFRALCARMADELDYYRQLLMDDRRETHALAAEARTALAEPQPPADGEVAELVVREIARTLRSLATTEKQIARHYSATLLTRAADLLARLSDGPAVQSREPASVTTEPSDQELYDYWISTSPEFGCADPVGFARAVLAHWGNAMPQLIPVSERLPEAGDCDAKGRCWWGAPDRLGAVAAWDLEMSPATDDTHWLPAHALPLPSGEVE